MARPVALTPVRAAAARQMRRTAATLDHDHPETVAGDHVRDAARVLEHGSTEGSKRHLDAAMEVLTPRNLMRHGITDDEGHATAKHHMHQVHRHRLAVQDIEDTASKNEQIAAAVKSARETIAATDAAAAAARQDGKPAPSGAQAPEGAPGPAPQQKAPVLTRPVPGAAPVRPSRPRVPAGAHLANAVELKNAAWMTERRGRGGEWVPSDPGAFASMIGGSVKGKAARPYRDPAQASLHRALFGKRVSKDEADAFAGMFGAPKLKSVAGDRATLTKSQRVIYDKLRRKGRGHARAMLIASRFSPEQLRAAALAGSGPAVLLADTHFSPAEPRGRGGQWVKSSSRINTVLHGTTVTGRTRDGTEITGMYHHYLGTIRPQPGGHPVPVTEVLNPDPGYGRREAAGRRKTQGRPGFFERVANRVGGFGPPVQFAGLRQAVELRYDPGQPRGAHGRWVHTGAPSVRISKITGVHGPGSFHHARFMDRYADTQLSHPDSKRLVHMATAAMVSRDFGAAQRHLAGARWHDAHFEGGAHLADLDELARGVRQAAARPPLGGRLHPRSPGSALGPGYRHPGRYEPSKGNLTGYAGDHPAAAELSARTAALERTPAPRGRPGGPGLYDVKGMGHTAYFQQVVKALITKRGMPEDKAYRIAWGALRKWRRGGGHTHPEVRAAATGALAGEAARGAQARASHGHANGGGAIELVGPHGYVHGWRFVGIPAVGAKVRMPRGRLGTVVGGNHQHARIRTANGDIFKIPHDKGPGPARLVKDTSRPDPAPYPKLSPERMKMKRAADKSITRGETLFHGTNHQFKPGDIIDAQHSRRGVSLLHEGKNYAFASTDPGEATFAGRVGREGHVYRVVPAGGYEYDPHQGSATSRRTAAGFRVVEEVSQWSGKPMAHGHATAAWEVAEHLIELAVT